MEPLWWQTSRMPEKEDVEEAGSSLPGTGIFMTLILKPELNPSNASMLTLVAAMAVAKGITRCTGMEAKIKWPNDIVINGKKVVGILTEMSAQMDYVNPYCVGMVSM